MAQVAVLAGNLQITLLSPLSGSNQRRMWDMFNAWYQQAEKLESGEITKEEYDQWRYTYPKMEAEQTRQELDALREKRKAENNTD